MINRHKQQSEFEVFFWLHSKDKRQVSVFEIVGLGLPQEQC